MQYYMQYIANMLLKPVKADALPIRGQRIVDSLYGNKVLLSDTN